MNTSGNLKSKKLTKLFNEIEPTAFNPELDKYVIFSDQHIGMPGFERNKDLYLKALDYYYDQGYTMIAVGDFEELHRFKFKKLKEEFQKDLYAREQKFLIDKRYYRIFGNHDIDWKKPSKKLRGLMNEVMPELQFMEALKFKWGGNTIFLTHGHQGNLLDDKLGKLGRFVLRYIVQPLGISSLTSPAKNHKKRRKDENIFYNWAKEKKALLIAGHTHRPMFESLSKVDRIKIKIEELLRDLCKLSQSEETEKKRNEILKQKEEFQRIKTEEGEKADWGGLGQSNLIIPCYFNCGSCLHKNGITCIELGHNKVKLILIYDKTKKANIGKEQRAPTEDLFPGDPHLTNYKKQKLEEDDLDYILTRIQLLA